MPSTSRSPSPRRDRYDRRSPRPSDRSKDQSYSRQEPPYPSSSSSKDRTRDEDRYRDARDSRTDSRRDDRSSHSHRRGKHDEERHRSSRHREERDRDGSRRHGDDRERSRRHDDDRERTRRHRDERESGRSSRPAEDDEERRRRHRRRDDEEERERRSQRDRDPPRSSRRQDESIAPPAEDLPLEEDQDQPDFAPSGLLARESNQKNGTALKYREPPEAKKPKLKWRLYVFKAGEQVDLFHVSRQSCYLFGRDKNVVDVQLDHESCSKQHAVLQFRLLTQRDEFGEEKRSTKPYVWDLESSNGTSVNSKEITPLTYHELKNGDTMKFGGSEREWVLLCEEG